MSTRKKAAKKAPKKADDRVPRRKGRRSKDAPDWPPFPSTTRARIECLVGMMERHEYLPGDGTHLAEAWDVNRQSVERWAFAAGFHVRHKITDEQMHNYIATQLFAAAEEGGTTRVAALKLQAQLRGFLIKKTENETTIKGDEKTEALVAKLSRVVKAGREDAAKKGESDE